MLREFAAWWGMSRSTAFRAQRRFRRSFPGESTPDRLLEAIDGTWDEREGLSAELQKHCDYLVKIPTRFSVNLGVAAALVMYDRLLTLGRHAPRPVAEGAPTEAAPLPVFGDPIYKRKRRLRARTRPPS